jgi:hypothetical protein
MYDLSELAKAYNIPLKPMAVITVMSKVKEYLEPKKGIIFTSQSSFCESLEEAMDELCQI